MDKSNARLLYEKLDHAYIVENMVGKEFENNWLECKEKSRAHHGGLDEGDQVYFAKALSGFANTSGGVLIFGLEARKKEGVDQIQSIKPLQQLKRFESGLREQESRAVERPVPGVEYKPIKINQEEDEGLLAIFIPQSPHVPHRSVKDKEFYLRAGGVFSSLPLTLIEDLFFRRLRPQLKLYFGIRNNNHIIVTLQNNGEVSAKWPHIVIQFPVEIEQVGFELDGFARLHTWHRTDEYLGQKGRYFIFLNSSNTVVHPQSEIPLLRLDRRNGRPNQGTGEVVKFRCYLTAENMIPIEDEYSIDIGNMT